MPEYRSTNQDWLPASDAVELLGVKRATLYTYASRGQVRTRAAGGRSKLYHRGDLFRLRARAREHAGTAARAASALDWGGAVLDTRVSGIDPDGPYYRGTCVLDLLDQSIESTAELLWELPAEPWPQPQRVATAHTLLELRRVVDALASRDPLRSVDSPAQARQLLVDLSAAVGGTGDSVVARLAQGRDPALVGATLVLLAEHELNASTFTARVVAGTGADLYACVSAALCALSGPRHGTASQRLWQVVQGTPADGPLPGFGHPLYPQGDPRAQALLAMVDLGGFRLSALRRVLQKAADSGLSPNIDAALLAVLLSLDLPVSLAPMWFGVARTVGWVAHVWEQRASDQLLRPRARFSPWAAG